MPNKTPELTKEERAAALAKAAKARMERAALKDNIKAGKVSVAEVLDMEGDVARRMAILMTARMDPELMTCRDVVSTGRYPYTGHLGVLRPEDKAIVEQSLRETDALDFADRPFQSISDGQRQRVLLARALCQQPELIVLDEPTSFLDIRYKLELLTILKRMVREEHLAVLMSLHELDLAARVSDTVVCVAGDRIDRIGPPSEIFTPDYIAALYRMEPGKYDPCFDSLEFVPGGAR